MWHSVSLEMTFRRTGFGPCLLEILPSWWLFPGLTRQGSVNSTRPVWSGGQSCWSMGRQQWLWHTVRWRGSLKVFLAVSLYSLSLPLLFCSSVLSPAPLPLPLSKWTGVKAVTPERRVGVGGAQRPLSLVETLQLYHTCGTSTQWELTLIRLLCFEECTLVCAVSLIKHIQTRSFLFTQK